MEKGLISVDRWSEGSQVYFLTHLHSDHTRGLTSAWSRGPLFCSRLTAKLFPFKFPDFDLSLLRVLEDGSWYSVPLVSPSSGSETVVQVMAIDAHHCPGAVMFLFRGNFGCLLYTGDFRWEADSERAKKGRTILHNALENDVIDVLYLDNTYCNPSYIFPSREVAAQQVINIIASHPEYDIIIGIDSLGKEDLLIQISRRLKTKIWVWPERLQTMHLLGFHDIFTTKTTLTRIRAVPRYSFSIDTLESLNMMRPTIGIMPSGLPWVKPTKGNDNFVGSLLTSHYKRSRSSSNGGKADEMTGNLISIDRFHRYIYSVPYSDHSSFTEIQQFIELVKPINMKGIVSASACYVDPLYYFGRLCGVNKISQRLYVKLEREEEGKRIASNKSKYCFGDFNPNATKRKRKKTILDCLGVHRSKVNVLRWKRRGAKIAENESST